VFDFDRRIERRGSGSFKWDDNRKQFGRDDVLPFWVADMDFATPEPVLAALRERCTHPVLGYERRVDAHYAAVIDWLASRYDWRVPREWLMFCPPGPIVAINALVETLSRSGDGVVVPAPNYGPLNALVENTGRRLLRVPLGEVEGGYVLDVDALDAASDADTRLIVNSSPHNPTGRVFRNKELEALAELAQERDLIVVSDEVHADLILPGHRHIPYGSIGGDRSVTVISPNKTFNTAGIPQSTLIIPDADIRAALQRFIDTMALNHDTTFGALGMLTAYTSCADWLDELLAYLDGNHRLVAEFLAARVPGVRKVPAEATYLAWLDCRGTGLSEAELQDRLVQRGRVALFPGSEFGEGYEGFVRMNIACPRQQLERGLEGVRLALTDTS